MLHKLFCQDKNFFSIMMGQDFFRKILNGLMIKMLKIIHLISKNKCHNLIMILIIMMQ